MSVIRPDLPLSPSSQGVAPPNARNLQAAFFRAALDQAQAQATQPAAAVMSTIRTANPARPVEAPSAAPEREEPRIMRPGSYLDIRV